MAEKSKRSFSASMMCKACFYKLRHFPDKVLPLLGKNRCPRCKRRNRVHVKLRDGIYETTYVRNKPSTTWPIKCDPSRRKCEGDQCLFAHGEEELTKWQEEYTQGIKQPQAGPEKLELPRPPSPVAEPDYSATGEWPDWDHIRKEEASSKSSTKKEESSTMSGVQDTMEASVALDASRDHHSASQASCDQSHDVSRLANVSGTPVVASHGPVGTSMEARWHEQQSQNVGEGTSQETRISYPQQDGEAPSKRKSDQETKTASINSKKESEEPKGTLQNELMTVREASGSSMRTKSPASFYSREVKAAEREQVTLATKQKKKKKSGSKKPLSSISNEPVYAGAVSDSIFFEDSKNFVSDRSAELHGTKTSEAAGKKLAVNESEITIKEDDMLIPSNKIAGRTSAVGSDLKESPSSEKCGAKLNEGVGLSTSSQRGRAANPTKETRKQTPQTLESNVTKHHSNVRSKKSGEVKSNQSNEASAAVSLWEFVKPKQKKHMQTFSNQSTSLLPGKASLQQKGKSKYNDMYFSDLNTYDFHQKLTKDNYREKFHRLLCLEEKEHASQLAQRLIYEFEKIGRYKESLPTVES